MNYSEFQKLKKIPEIGTEMYDMMVKLYPICRSITGDGVRKTLDIISEQVPLEKHEILTGTEVFDWTIPKEWNIRDAYVKKSNGKKIIDFQKSNLHVLNYSVPVHNTVSLSELKAHLFTLPDQPTLIPYRTSYYYENWGFCITHNQFLQLEEDEYEVVIDSTLEDGSLSYGEYFIKGQYEDEVLLSCYTCHPSMCNDNLSGIVLLTFLAKHLKNLSLKYSYRFLFIPETIGAIAWMCRNEHNLKKIKHGLVVTCVGDPGILSYKKSRKGNTEIDQTVIDVLKKSGEDFSVLDFFPFGSDERQYNSPGIDLPIATIFRTKFGKNPEYHTSLDDFSVVTERGIKGAFKVVKEAINILNKKIIPKNIILCEPQMGKRSLRSTLSTKGIKKSTFDYMNFLQYADGKNDLKKISELIKLSYKDTFKIYNILAKYKLIK